MKAKKKKCKVCRQPFTPWNTLQKACSPKCALEFVRARQRAERRKDTRRRKEAMKTRSDWLKEAQTAFNRYIRERDKHENCISCGREPKKRNAGHYKSVGSHPELRFSELNCHLQCEYCNTHKSGNQVEYRKSLLCKIGEANLRWLEGQHKAQKWTILDIKEIKQYFNEQYRILKND